jgi:hypothetical protein
MKHISPNTTRTFDFYRRSSPGGNHVIVGRLIADGGICACVIFNVATARPVAEAKRPKRENDKETDEKFPVARIALFEKTPHRRAYHESHYDVGVTLPYGRSRYDGDINNNRGNSADDEQKVDRNLFLFLTVRHQTPISALIGFSAPRGLNRGEHLAACLNMVEAGTAETLAFVWLSAIENSLDDLS